MLHRSLLARVAVVDDCSSAQTMALTVSNRIKHRAKASYNYNTLILVYRECIHVFFNIRRWCLGVEILFALQHSQLMKVLSGQQHIRYTFVVNSISCLTSQLKCSLDLLYQKRGHLTYAFLRLTILKAECK